MSSILVSVIIPVFNAEKYLAETLNSVLKQTYSNWECLIIDDGSKDSSQQIALDFCNKDLRFKYFRKKNEGPSPTRNFGFEKAQGKFIQYLDADDIILPTRLEIMIGESTKTTENIINYSDLLIGKSNNIYDTSKMNLPASIGRDIKFRDMYKGFAVDFLFIPSCLFFPKQTIKNVTWNNKIVQAEDWDYYLQILSHNYVFHFVPQALVIYRDTENSLSKDFKSTIKSSYKILFRWAQKGNFLDFSKRSAKLYNRNLFYFLNKKIDCIVKPNYELKNKSLVLRLFILLILPFKVFYLTQEIAKISLKKTRRVLRIN